LTIDTKVTDEIRAAATMASLALALLVFFTNVRRDALKTYLAQVQPFGARTVWDALPDLVLAVFTAAAVVSLAPLCFDTFQLDEVGRRSGVVPSMFGLIWLGFVLVLGFQLWMLGRRFFAAITAG
jgi:hypothetical protein